MEVSYVQSKQSKEIEEKWYLACKLLNKNIKTEYINYNVRKYKLWERNQKVLALVFEDLYSEDPYTVKLDYKSINRRYWDKVNQKRDVNQEIEAIECKYSLCKDDGFLEAKKNGYKITFKCPCDMGHKIKDGGVLTFWKDIYETIGYERIENGND